MNNNLLSALKGKLSKDDFNLIMEIYLTPFSEGDTRSTTVVNPYATAKASLQSWLKEDRERLAWLKEAAGYYNNVYIKSINKEPMFAQQAKEICLSLRKEARKLNDRLCQTSNPDKRVIKWH